MSSAPPLNEDFRLVEALQAQRPGAVGHVYNVYGPELVEYAEGLLGGHERAVEAVREALLALRDADVPDAGTFRDWLYELVRDQCRATPARKRGRGRLVVIGGAAAAVALTGGMLVLFESTEPEPKPSAAPPVAMVTPAIPAPSATSTPTPKDSIKRDEPKPTKKAAAPKKSRRAPSGPGRLSVDDGGCHGVRAAGLPTRCYIGLTAVGGPVRWSVSSVRDRAGRVSAGGGGTLAAGRSASVAVTVRPTVLCYIGGRGTGTVTFEPGGTATVTYTCWRR